MPSDPGSIAEAKRPVRFSVQPANEPATSPRLVCDADVCPLERRGIVDTVPRHRHGLAHRLQRLNQTQLVPRAGACENIDVASHPAQVIIVQFIYLSPGHRWLLTSDAKSFANHSRGVDMIAGDHLDPDAS